MRQLALEPGLLQAQREEGAEHHAIAERAELQQVREPDARIAPRRGEASAQDARQRHGRRALARRAALQPDEHQHRRQRAQRRGQLHSVIRPAASASTPVLRPASSASGRAAAPAQPRPGPGRSRRRPPAGRAMPPPACPRAPSLTWCRSRRRPTEKNSAQPASCGTVRASGYSRKPAASHRNPKAYTARRPILSASAPNGATRHNASSSLAKLSADTVRPCRSASQPQVHVQQVRLHVAHEREQPDGDERRI